MQTTLRTVIGLGAIALVGLLAGAPPAWSDDGDKHRGRGRHERRGDDHDRHRRGADTKEWERRREAEKRRHEWRRAAERREWERRRDLDRHRAAAYWRFERNHGWRFEHRPGAWSPVFVWWLIDGRPHLRPYPAARIVRYPTGYYELVGDGITTAYYWIWRPTVVIAAPPPVPLPPPPPARYPFPADGYHPPPPRG
ncbi:MAG: hypothetical protein FJ027_04240 [Candidatus Rokubacteria bacterium]|nr:hypothetical protein [Candidatus Rokubacteria bacterium]